MFKQARREKNLTQLQLAEMVGCSQGNLANWETGRFPIPEHYRMELQKVLQCHIPAHVPKPRGRKRQNFETDTISVSFHLSETQWLKLKKMSHDVGLSMVEYLVRELELGD